MDVLASAKVPNVGRRQTHVLGDRRGDFRKAWLRARNATGCPVRNMVNAGLAERMAMQVTGHRTRSVFDRYHIVSPSDLQDVARQLSGTIAGTIVSAAAATSLTAAS